MISKILIMQWVYATSIDPFGPWEKATENPIISQRKIGDPRTGHGDLFYD
jgi:hypothetical protein